MAGQIAELAAPHAAPRLPPDRHHARPGSSCSTPRPPCSARSARSSAKAASSSSSGIGVEVAARTRRSSTSTPPASRSRTPTAPSRRIRVARRKIWAAGVQAQPARPACSASSRGAEVDRAGRVEVQPDLTLPGHPEVFVVGDMMALDNLPGVAQVAIQGGRYAARPDQARARRRADRRAVPATTTRAAWRRSRGSTPSPSIGKLQFAGSSPG